MNGITIVQQGSVLLNGIRSVKDLENIQEIALIVLDLKTKRAEIVGTSGGDNEPPCIMLSHTEESTHMNGESDEDTIVSFDRYAGWEIFSSEISKYTLRVTLIRTV